MTGRRKNGQWRSGTSGNPSGRPVGAKDKRPRRKNWCCHKYLTYAEEVAITARLGKYAERGHGGPGRPRGSYGRMRILTDAMRGDPDAMDRFWETL